MLRNKPSRLPALRDRAYRSLKGRHCRNLSGTAGIVFTRLKMILETFFHF